MGFHASDADLPTPRAGASDPRFVDLFGAPPDEADLILAGVPYDASVLGRKGARHGPTAIREAMRFLSSHDLDQDQDLAALRLADMGDVDGLDPTDVAGTHNTVTRAVAPLFSHGVPVLLLGGDHGLTFAHVRALHQERGGSIGIVVIDAHYDVRAYDRQPSSGTPFRRILEELPGAPVKGDNIAEIGIRPYANTASLARYAGEAGMRIFSAQDVRAQGITAVSDAAVAAAADAVDHLWLSIDIDGLDQSVAPGCSAPGPGGLRFEDVAHVVRQVAAHPKCRGMDVLEVAPGLDPSGNTARVAANLVATYAGIVATR